MFQKLKSTIAGVLLVFGLPLSAIVPVLVTAPAQAAAAGSCIVDTIQGKSVQTTGTCKSFIPSGTDAQGAKLDTSKCYELYEQNGATYIEDELDCSDPRLGGAALVLCPNGTKAPNNDASQCTDDTNVTCESACDGNDPAAQGGNCADVANCDLISKYASPFINLLSALVGVAVLASIIVGGIQYGTSAGDSQKVTAAKARIRNAIIALLTFIFLYAMLNFLIPGGLL